MFSNMVAQLREAGALDRLAEVYEELPRTRKELGSPPLVTPTSQIVGTQAVLNVLFGRYKMISKEVQGLRLRPLRQAAGGHRPRRPAGWRSRATSAARRRSPGAPPTCSNRSWRRPRTQRRASRATSATCSSTRSTPTTGLRFLKWKYGTGDRRRPKRSRRRIDQVKRENDAGVEGAQRPAGREGDRGRRRRCPPLHGPRRRRRRSRSRCADASNPAAVAAGPGFARARPAAPGSAILAPDAGVVLRYFVRRRRRRQGRRPGRRSRGDEDAEQPARPARRPRRLARLQGRATTSTEETCW